MLFILHVNPNVSELSFHDSGNIAAAGVAWLVFCGVVRCCKGQIFILRLSTWNASLSCQCTNFQMQNMAIYLYRWHVHVHGVRGTAGSKCRGLPQTEVLNLENVFAFVMEALPINFEQLQTWCFNSQNQCHTSCRQSYVISRSYELAINRWIPEMHRLISG